MSNKFWGFVKFYKKDIIPNVTEVHSCRVYCIYVVLERTLTYKLQSEKHRLLFNINFEKAFLVFGLKR
jgi:hypothetical protein